jgi:hypothetical protein
LEQISREIDGAQDFELGIERTSRLAYQCALPPNPAKGLVFIIAGFGDDGAAEYSQLMRRYICGRYDMVAVSVDYHASEARPPMAKYELLGEELCRVLGYLAIKDIHLKLDAANIDGFLSDVNKAGYPVKIAANLIPQNGDYQNFGVMQAMDHIFVLNDIINSGIEFDTNNIICLGSSHGAYIAHLIHKFAPNTINAVIDNSGYAIPLVQFIGGRPEYTVVMNNISLECNVVTKWRFENSYTPEFFGPGRYAIRDTLNAQHLAEAVAKSSRHCQFRMINSATDGISPVGMKETQCRLLQANGFDAQLRIVGEEDLDGKVLKSLGHGLDASMSGVFDLYADSFSVRPTTLDRKLGTALSFGCYDYVYRFQHLDKAPYLDAFCERIAP